MTDLISRRLRNMLSDHLSGWSVLREIESEFEAEAVPHEPLHSENTLGQRRTLVQEYYNGLDFTDPSDARKFLNVLSVFLSNLQALVGKSDHWGQNQSNEAAKVELAKFEAQLSRDGYAFRDGVISPVSAATRLSDAKAIATKFDAGHIHDQIRRIEASVDTDPALAIGTAKELVESCFKTILREREIEFGKDENLGSICIKVPNPAQD